MFCSDVNGAKIGLVENLGWGKGCVVERLGMEKWKFPGEGG